MRFSFSKKKFLKKIILGIGALLKYIIGGFAEGIAIANEIGEKAMGQAYGTWLLNVVILVCGFSPFGRRCVEKYIFCSILQVTV